MGIDSLWLCIRLMYLLEESLNARVVLSDIRKWHNAPLENGLPVFSCEIWVLLASYDFSESYRIFFNGCRLVMLRVDAKQGAPRDGNSLLEMFQVIEVPSFSPIFLV